MTKGVVGVAPPGADLIFDWNPAVDPFRDLVGGTKLTLDGTASIGRGFGNLPCLVCDGSGSLIGTSCPVSSLTDAGGLSIYVVAETDSVASGSAVAFEFALQNQASTNLGVLGVSRSAALVSVYNYASNVGRSQSQAGITADTLHVIQGHFSTTDIDAALDAAGVGVSAHAATDPDFDGVVIGATQLFATPGQFPRYSTVAWTGKIYRVLVYKTKTYNSAVVDGLAPSSGSPPETNLARWWNASTPLLSAEGDSAVYTAAGSPTTSTAHGLDSVLFTGSSDAYTGALPSTIDTSTTSYTLYFLISRSASWTGNLSIGGIESAAAPGTKYTTAVGNGSNVSAAENFEDSATGTAVALDTAEVVVVEFNHSTNTYRVGVDGTFGSAVAILDEDFDQHHIGAQTGYSARTNCHVMDALVYTGLYDQDVTDWLLARAS